MEGRRAPPGWRRGPVLRAAAAAAAPFAACLLLLAFYNVVRFGSPTEFGTNYQLAGLNPREFDFFSLDRLLRARGSICSSPRLSGSTSPSSLWRPSYPGTLPTGFFVEPVAGVLPVTPLLILLAAVPFLMRRARGPLSRELVGLGGVMVGVALLLPVISLVSARRRDRAVRG